jgi:hypothetical protein
MQIEYADRPARLRTGGEDDDEEQLLQALLILDRLQKGRNGEIYAFLTMAQYAIQRLMSPGGSDARKLQAARGRWFVC